MHYGFMRTFIINHDLHIQICPVSGLSDHLLLAVLALLWVEVSEHGRHLSQYFNLFAIYANLGTQVVGHRIFCSQCSLLYSSLLRRRKRSC